MVPIVNTSNDKVILKLSSFADVRFKFLQFEDEEFLIHHFGENVYYYIAQYGIIEKIIKCERMPNIFIEGRSDLDFHNENFNRLEQYVETLPISTNILKKSRHRLLLSDLLSRVMYRVPFDIRIVKTPNEYNDHIIRASFIEPSRLKHICTLRMAFDLIFDHKQFNKLKLYNNIYEELLYYNTVLP